MTLAVVADVVVAVCFLVGCGLALVAGIGLARFPDLLSRMHAATKPQVLGLSLMVLGLSIHLRDARVLGTLALVVVFQMITGPVAAHMVGRSGYRTGKVIPGLLVRDELTADLEAAERRAADAGEHPPAGPRGEHPPAGPRGEHPPAGPRGEHPPAGP
jgi:multicomponent Na+:H+ antiporter subunit G